MENQELFKQAILDAKAVRETAMAAARTTLAEHFEPFIKETMAKTLSEEMDEDKMEESMEKEGDHMEEKKHMDDKSKMEEAMDDASMEENSMMDESTLDEILAELDALSEEMEVEGKADMEEADESIEEGHVPEDGYVGKASKGQTGYDEKAKVSHGDHKLHEADDDKEDDKDAEKDDKAEKAGKDVTKGIEAAHDDEAAHDEQEVVDITVGDLKDIIRDVFMQLQGGGDFGSLEQDAFDAGTDLAQDLGTDGGEVKTDDEISLDEILAELEAEEKKMEEAAGAHEIPGGKVDPEASDVHKTQYDEMKKELNEAVRTIKALRAELNEVNLFSAKMLYVNKIFKSKNLTEAQKTKVINAFDRNTNVKEVENTYKTLMESIGESKKSTIKESVGFASKPIGNAPARPIVEADAFVSRWQQLAGIK